MRWDSLITVTWLVLLSISINFKTETLNIWTKFWFKIRHRKDVSVRSTYLWASPTHQSMALNHQIKKSFIFIYPQSINPRPYYNSSENNCNTFNMQNGAHQKFQYVDLVDSPPNSKEAWPAEYVKSKNGPHRMQLTTVRAFSQLTNASTSF